MGKHTREKHRYRTLNLVNFMFMFQEVTVWSSGEKVGEEFIQEMEDQVFGIVTKFIENKIESSSEVDVLGKLKTLLNKAKTKSKYIQSDNKKMFQNATKDLGKLLKYSQANSKGFIYKLREEKRKKEKERRKLKGKEKKKKGGGLFSRSKKRGPTTVQSHTNPSRADSEFDADDKRETGTIIFAGKGKYEGVNENGSYGVGSDDGSDYGDVQDSIVDGSSENEEEEEDNFDSLDSSTTGSEFNDLNSKLRKKSETMAVKSDAFGRKFGSMTQAFARKKSSQSPKKKLRSGLTIGFANYVNIPPKSMKSFRDASFQAAWILGANNKSYQITEPEPDLIDVAAQVGGHKEFAETGILTERPIFKEAKVQTAPKRVVTFDQASVQVDIKPETDFKGFQIQPKKVRKVHKKVDAIEKKDERKVRHKKTQVELIPLPEANKVPEELPFPSVLDPSITGNILPPNIEEPEDTNISLIDSKVEEIQKTIDQIKERMSKGPEERLIEKAEPTFEVNFGKAPDQLDESIELKQDGAEALFGGIDGSLEDSPEGEKKPVVDSSDEENPEDQTLELQDFLAEVDENPEEDNKRLEEIRKSIMQAKERESIRKASLFEMIPIIEGDAPEDPLTIGDLSKIEKPKEEEIQLQKVQEHLSPKKKIFLSDIQAQENSDDDDISSRNGSIGDSMLDRMIEIPRMRKKVIIGGDGFGLIQEKENFSSALQNGSDLFEKPKLIKKDQFLGKEGRLRAPAPQKPNVRRGPVSKKQFLKGISHDFIQRELERINMLYGSQKKNRYSKNDRVRIETYDCEVDIEGKHLSSN